ncbi:MAG: hypothetical protein AMXMBFR82_11530 [Candidatus Hydrogenedentota bacterium]
MREQLRTDVENLATPQGRMAGTRGHAEARAYVIERCGAAGLVPVHDGSFELPYAAGDIRLTNVIGALPGSRPELDPVLIAAHYDTCGPFPGADDNAAAIAIALASVEGLRQRALERTVLFAFFDAEEPPHFLTPLMGSTHYYNHQRDRAIHCAIVLDLVGHAVPIPGREDLLFVMGMESDPALERVVQDCEPESGIRTVATLNRYVGDMSDHHVFRVNERPYLFLSCGQWEHYHLPTDTPEKLDYQKMGHIVNYLCNITAATAAAGLAGPFEGYDTLGTELRLLEKHVGDLARQFGISLKTREELEALVFLMVTRFGLLTDR